MTIESESTHRETKRIKKTHQSPILAEDSQPLPNLPPEIIVEILSRLPVKSLLQFRSVCKSWRSLISNPQFVKTHLSIASKSDDYTHQRLILSPTHLHFNMKSCSLYSVFYEQSDSAVQLDCPMKNPRHSVSIVGSCNGLLVFIVIEEDAIYLWNPSTRKSKRLSIPGLGDDCFAVYGFGYDESIDDYKLVGMFCVEGSGTSDETEVKIYTLRTDSWRRIGDFTYGFPLDDSGKFVNGALHWAASGVTGSSYSWVIISLDLAKETFGEIVQPEYGDDGDLDLTVGVLNGCLCVLCNFPDTCFDVWVMKEYGIRESWTKLFALSYLNPWDFNCATVVCISKNGEVLLQFGSRLVLYNPKDVTYRNPAIHNLCTCHPVDIYVESLVSPNADTDNEV